MQFLQLRRGWTNSLKGVPSLCSNPQLSSPILDIDSYLQQQLLRQINRSLRTSYTPLYSYIPDFDIFNPRLVYFKIDFGLMSSPRSRSASPTPSVEEISISEFAASNNRRAIASHGLVREFPTVFEAVTTGALTEHVRQVADWRIAA